MFVTTTNSAFVGTTVTGTAKFKCNKMISPGVVDYKTVEKPIKITISAPPAKPYCGNTIVETGEQCDLGSGNSLTGFCLPTCKTHTCGDGNVYAKVEACDPAPSSANPSGCICTANCTCQSCGDGTIQPPEQCDNGAGNNNNTAACTSQCKDAFCGDGFVQTGVEQCDDSNTNNNDACSNQCKNATCTDGIAQSGLEVCDTIIDSNCVVTGSGPVCGPNVCGDGTLGGMEQCDDGNTANGDGCNSSCYLESTACKTWGQPVCVPASPGVCKAERQCDDTGVWAPYPQFKCSSCSPPVCGNGKPEPGEECDKGFKKNSDTSACTTQCKDAICGDGFIYPGAGEKCDNGPANGKSGSTCGVGCQPTTKPPVICNSTCSQAGVGTPTPGVSGSYNLTIHCSGGASGGQIRVSVSSGSVTPSIINGIQGDPKVTCNANAAEPEFKYVGYDANGTLIPNCSSTIQLSCGQ